MQSKELKEAIQILSKFNQPAVSGRSEQFFCFTYDRKDRLNPCENQCDKCKEWENLAK
jgi:hypothetical protein